MYHTEVKLSDAALVSLYLDGSEVSLERLIKRHQQRILNFIFSKVLDRETAEDIFQDTFIKVVKTLKNGVYNEEGKFLPWVMRISHNLVIDHFRKNSRMPKFEGKGDFSIFDVLKEDIDILMTFSSILISFIVSFFTIKWFLSFVKKVGFLPFIIYRLFLGVSILWLI